MKLSVQDLAMFIGCECEIVQSSIPDMRAKWFSKVGDTVKIEPVLLLTVTQGYMVVKPILRPCKSISMEEYKEVFYDSELDFMGCATLDEQFRGHRTDPNIARTPEEFKWLISKHFDVFGWIEKGLAISKV